MENYNGYIKRILGKNRIINWVNFLNFIKDESERSITKLLDNSNIKFFILFLSILKKIFILKMLYIQTKKLILFMKKTKKRRVKIIKTQKNMMKI